MRFAAIAAIFVASLCARAHAQASQVVPLTVFRSGHVAVPVRVNGKGPFRLVFDTGSPVTFVSSRVAKLVGLASSAGPAGGMMGLGMSLNPFAKVRTISVGGAMVKDMNIMVLDHPVIQMLGAVEGPVDGIVGFTFFSRFRTTLDYANRQVAFAPASYLPADVVQNVLKLLTRRTDERRVIRPAALWGISLEDSAAGPVVKTVYPESRSAEAGVRPGDRIISVDGRWAASVLGFFELASVVKPGATAAVIVDRAGRELSLRVTPQWGL